MSNIKLTVAYDGTLYKGWQKTKMGPSIEGVLQDAVEQILQHPIRLQAASRTDAGVHAEGQIVNFITTKEVHPLSKFCIGLNSLLPKDIVILEAEIMPDSFHPTLDVTSKEYHYYICFGKTQMPQHRFYSWHYHYPLNLDLMKQAAEILCGHHNFSSFCNVKKNETYESFDRTIENISIQQIDNFRLQFKIKGNNFLYKMVRNLVGTIAYVGRGKIQNEDLLIILQAQDRKQSGVTAPAHGLFLHKVFY